MSIFIRLCPNEKSLIQILQPLLLNPSYQHIKLDYDKTLAEGDVIMGIDQNNHFCLERKTLADLKASVFGSNDGRYKTQNARMHSLRKKGAVKGIGYIIETMIKNEKEMEMDHVLDSLRYKHLMIVKIVPDSVATCHFILGLAVKLPEYSKYYQMESEKLDLLGLPVKSNQQEIKGNPLFVRQLCLIVPLNTALVIYSKYPDMKSLLSAWYQCEQSQGDPKAMLIGLRDPLATKAIGKITSLKLYESFYFRISSI